MQDMMKVLKKGVLVTGKHLLNIIIEILED